MTPLKRECGDCTLCCRLLPVRELDKGADERCRYQCVSGCRVYRTDAMPMSCRMWNCQWLTGQTARDMRRPDRAHYVVDMMPDYVEIEDNETGERTPIPVLQVWCDPKHPEAHRDPALRAWLAELPAAALVRFDHRRAILVVPPAINAAGIWHEQDSSMQPGPAHSAEDVMAHTGMRVRLELAK